MNMAAKKPQESMKVEILQTSFSNKNPIPLEINDI